MLPIEQTIFRELMGNARFTETVMPYLKVEYFHTAACQHLFGLYQKFYSQYHRTPSFSALRIGLDSVENLRDQEVKEAHAALTEIEKVDRLSEDQYPWLWKEVESWCQERSVYLGLQQCIGIMNDPKTPNHALIDIIKNSLAVTFDTQVGHDYSADAEARWEAYHNQEAKIPFNLECLNQITRGGIVPKTLNVVIAGCHRKGERVLMMDGSTKAVESVVVGDRLMGWDGTPRIVQALKNGKSPIYRVHVKATGEHYDVNDSHVLTLVATDTDEVVDIPVLEYLQKSAKWKHRHKTFYNNNQLIFENSKPLLVDPYVLGVWLGDGHTHGVAVTSMDAEVSDAWMAFGKQQGAELRITNNGSKADAIYLVLNGSNEWSHRTNGIADLFNFYGLHITNSEKRTKCEDKFIPFEYKTAGVSERLELLAGLLDTDGSLNAPDRQSYDFCVKSKRLRDDVVFVARSLGFYCYTSERLVGGATYYRTSVCPTATTPIIPVRIKRKQPNGAFHVRRNLTRSSLTLEPLGEDEYFGFVVDSDHRYLLENFIVTHNTNVGKSLFLSHLAAHYRNIGKNVLYITLEMGDVWIGQRIDANSLNIPIDDLEKLSKDEFLERVKKRDRGRLIIKEYPTGKGSVAHFTALINELRMKKQFVPDVVMIDYITIAASANYKRGSVNLYEYYKAVSEEFRGFASEHNVGLWTAAQFNRKGFETSDPGLSDVAESFGIPQTADFAIALTQTEEQEKDGQLSIIPLKNRYNKRQSFLHLTVGVDTGRMKVYDLDESTHVPDLARQLPVFPSSDSDKPTPSTFKSLRRPPPLSHLTGASG